MTRTALRVDARESLRAAGGALVAILLTGVIARWAGAQWGASAWLVAPIGASAVLVFALPASPLARPWPVIAGNTLSALVGIGFARWLSDPNLAAALAVATAIGVMRLLRCLHPPGGAMAVLAALTGITDPSFALFPVLTDSVLLMAIAMAFRRIVAPRVPDPVAAPAPTKPMPLDFTPADVDAALDRHNRALDVEREDLEAVLHHAQANAYARTMGALTCRDAMSVHPCAVDAGTSIRDAWTLLRDRSIKALPVVDTQSRIVGIVTLADFVRWMIEDPASSLARGPGAGRAIAEIMTRQVRVAGETLRLVELLPLFSEGGHHHLPVVDASTRLVGMITQSDVVRALHRPPH